mmetsp:Transcript_16188/g.44825  ORF Transcript_16188/g.44825 Transcript_16188/m.44825 type:complete len:95 (-) Transcript_16188:947-1231(-)
MIKVTAKLPRSPKATRSIGTNNNGSRIILECSTKYGSEQKRLLHLLSTKTVFSKREANGGHPLFHDEGMIILIVQSDSNIHTNSGKVRHHKLLN